MWNALIIDDERLARKDLISMLTAYSNINIAGEAEDVPSAVKAIAELDPDVIFLDIQMPGESGFDLLGKIDSGRKVIFVTAFDEFAVRAFEVNALDYLLKPVNPERLADALLRLEQEYEKNELAERKLTYHDRLFLNLGNRFQFLKINTIISIIAAGDYSEVVTEKGRIGLALKSMREWESRLPGQYFIRIHRSTIINMEYIDRIEEWFNYSFRVYLKHSEEPLVLSRRYAAKLKEKMG